MQAIRKALDYRRAYIRRTVAIGETQMASYFQARYSWGQPCDPMRSTDWGTLCAYLRKCQVEGLEVDYRKVWAWPSGNKGTIGGLVDIYHDGWQLLADLGLVDNLED